MRSIEFIEDQFPPLLMKHVYFGAKDREVSICEWSNGVVVIDVRRFGCLPSRIAMTQKAYMMLRDALNYLDDDYCGKFHLEVREENFEGDFLKPAQYRKDWHDHHIHLPRSGPRHSGGPPLQVLGPGRRHPLLPEAWRSHPSAGAGTATEGAIMLIHVCTTCGSPRVWADAYAALNSEEVRTYDDTRCDDCDGECKTQEVEVPATFNLETDFYKEESCSSSPGSV